MVFATAEALIQDISEGKMVILLDDEDRENEGDLVLAAQHVTPEIINFMAKHARGLICLTLTQARCQQLGLGPMVIKPGGQHSTNFTVSIEAASGVTTGISAADRARTIQVAVAAQAIPQDIVMPGHVFPLMAVKGGVLNRAGHTEAGCDLARLAGLEPAAVIVEIMNDDGTMARRPDLELFAEKHQLKMGTIADIIDYRLRTEKTVQRAHQRALETAWGSFQCYTYTHIDEPLTHLALVHGDLSVVKNPLVRVHVGDLYRDVLQVQTDTCGWTLPKALSAIKQSEAGILILIDTPNHPLNATAATARFFDQSTNKTSEQSSYKTIGTGSQILLDLGVESMQLLNSPIKFNALSGFGLSIEHYISPTD
jgi:3,4-dihydroxy 2-butanone 4-phosphate synthase/GTP cyclohydrolase II